MTPLDLVGHFAYILMIIGHLFVTEKKPSGFILRIIGGLIWVILGVMMGMTSIVVWSIVFSFIDLTGFIKWVRKMV